jgi:hypothetical protein
MMRATARTRRWVPCGVGAPRGTRLSSVTDPLRSAAGTTPGVGIIGAAARGEGCGVVFIYTPLIAKSLNAL